MSSKKGQRFLAVFDFDHTIVDKNSDVVLRDLLPKEVVDSGELKDIRRLSWTKYMAEIFRRLPRHGANKETIISCCQTLTPCDGMIDLFHTLRDASADVMILSDANSVIIESWLSHNLPDMSVDVHTNPASWSDRDVLVMRPFQQQNVCSLCPTNLCKGSVLSSALDSRTAYDFVTYTGDGKNDLCPGLILRSVDMLFPRKGFTLEKLLSSHPINASVHLWSSAAEIQKKILERLNESPIS